MQIAVADIGGTNARFSLADVADGRVIALSDPVVLPAAAHAGLADAWRAFGAALDVPLPRHAALGLAGPVTGGPVHFVNSHWVVDPARLNADLGIDSHLLLNDFGAMAHAVDALGDEWLVPVCGPDVPLPHTGAISVIGPGTGLGVAVLQRLPDGGRVVLETEGSHVHFAPLDAGEARLNAALAARHGRVSIERIVSGPGLGEIVRADAPADRRSDAALWQAACDGELPTALDRFLAAYGAAAGDLALAHGATGVALTGGLTNRLLPHITTSRFHARFCDKGRYRARMEATPVRLVTHPQPGLFGAAAAFAKLR